MRKRLFLSLALVFGVSAWAVPSLKPDIAELRKFCRAHRVGASEFFLEAPEVGRVTYLPTVALDATQGRFSLTAIQRKLKKSFKAEPDAYVDEKHDQWVFTHDHGRSFFPSSKNIKGIYYRGRLYITDGHHRSLISAYIGAETIPVKVIADFSQRFSPTQFWDYLERNGLSYFRNYRGQATQRVELCEMVDDPNLELARMLIARADVRFDRGRVVVEEVRGKKWVIGMKTDEDIPFLENEVADALHRRGVEWDADFRDPDKKDLREFLAMLEDARKRPESRLRQVLLFDQPRRVADLDSETLLLEHLRDRGCEYALAKRRE
jgi:hypothetical protein